MKKLKKTENNTLYQRIYKGQKIIVSASDKEEAEIKILSIIKKL